MRKLGQEAARKRAIEAKKKEQHRQLAARKRKILGFCIKYSQGLNNRRAGVRPK